MKKFERNKKEKGFALLEILIALVVITISFLAGVSFLFFARQASSKAIQKTEAVSLAEEALEAVRNLRDESWSGNIEALAAGTTYYPTLSAGKWTLSTTNPSSSSTYTTTVVFSLVNRDASANISAVGSNDPNTRKIVASVSWKEANTTETVALTAYVTNFLGN
ncbi:MAG: type II secretion system protein [bacterium]|nr:type II secretion system protein [bacterium]